MNTRKFNPIFPSVFTDEKGVHRVVLPSGEEIPHLTETVVTDKAGAGEIPVLAFKVVVNLVSTKEEAIKLYQTEK